MAVRVRPAADAELAAVGRLTAQVYLEEGFCAPGDPYLEVLADAAGRARLAEVWVAADDGELLGTVTFCRPGTAYAELSRADEGEFRMLAVAGAARGRGAGRALVRACLDRARELGLTGVRISSLPEMTRAHRLYLSMGFRRAPQDDWTPVPQVTLLAFVARLDQDGS